MKQYEIQITDNALSDLEEIYNYIAEQLQTPEAAMRQYNRIANAIETLDNQEVARTELLPYWSCPECASSLPVYFNIAKYISNCSYTSLQTISPLLPSCFYYGIHRMLCKPSQHFLDTLSRIFKSRSELLLM
jgi:hypothetical protein